MRCSTRARGATPRTSDDRGAVAVLLALSCTALLGFGALVVDVGTWYAEGRQLQNGATAAAVAVAQECVRDGVCDPSVAESGLSGSYAGLNAEDGRSRVVSVCGTGPGLSGCATPPREALYDCQPRGSGSAPYVEVRTRTLTAGGQERMPPLLVRALRPGDTGKQVRACARASYGAPSRLRSRLPLTVSRCEVVAHAGGIPPTVLAPVGPYPPWPASYERTLYFHDTTEAGPTSCSGSPSGMDDPLSGGFGWLDSTDCETTSSTSGWHATDPGASVPSDCSNSALRALRGQVVDLPVFYDQNGRGGANGAYRIGTYVAFVLTGYQLGGQHKEPSLITGRLPCSGSQRCLSGFFTRDPAPGVGLVDGPSTGVSVVQITG